MLLYPAIDICQGRVVRLKQGLFTAETVYSHDPLAVARDWERQGAKWLHIVDLDGAKHGYPVNLDIIHKIRLAVQCQLQIGGGVRTISHLDNLIATGINRLVLGTKALDEHFLREAVQRYPGKIVIGIDVQNGKIRTEGWLKDSIHDMEGFLKLLNIYPIEAIIYTDIGRDGMLNGPNWTALSHVLEATFQKVILSGGVSTLDYIRRCCQINNENFDGVIIGKALYEKKITLTECLSVVAQNRKA